MDVSIRNEEKRVFLKAFFAYMCPFVEKANAVAIVKAKDGVSVEFEFHEDNSIITTRRFEEDLIFAHKIAVEAIEEEAKKRDNWEIHKEKVKKEDECETYKDEEDTEVRFILAIKN